MCVQVGLYKYQILMNLKVANSIHYCIPIETSSHIPLFLSLLLDLLCNAVSPPLRCQWFLVDVILRMMEMISSVVDFCLSPCCNMSSIKRSRSLTQLVTSATSLLSLSLGFEGATENLLCRLLRYRLQEGPHSDWKSLDLALPLAFERSLVYPPNKAVVVLILDELRKDTWGDVGKELRVRAISFVQNVVLTFIMKNLAIAYLRVCLPHLDADTFRTVNEVLSTIDEAGSVSDHQLAVANPVDTVNAGEPVEETTNWRQQLRRDLQEILVPEAVSRMEDDESLPDQDYAKRALHGLLDRFTR